MEVINKTAQELALKDMPDEIWIRRFNDKPTGIEIVFGEVDQPMFKYVRADSLTPPSNDAIIKALDVIEKADEYNYGELCREFVQDYGNTIRQSRAGQEGEDEDCWSCGLYGCIEVEPDSNIFHPCEDCRPELFKAWKQGVEYQKTHPARAVDVGGIIKALDVIEKADEYNYGELCREFVQDYGNTIRQSRAGQEGEDEEVRNAMWENNICRKAKR